MPSITWPSGLERPSLPTLRRSPPVPESGTPYETEVGDRLDEAGVRVIHLAAWCVAGAIGWVAVIGVGWLVAGFLVDVLR